MKRGARFNQMHRALVALVDQPGLHLSRRDHTLTVDLPSLDSCCSDLQKLIRAVAGSRGAGESAARRVGRLWAQVDNLDLYVRDLRGPLDRLHARLSRLARKEVKKGRPRSRSA